MKKNVFIFSREGRKTGKLNSVIRFIFILSVFAAFFVATSILPGCNNRKDRDAFTNEVETYLVKWWYIPTSPGTPPNPAARPVYGIININNEVFTVRHAILEGRPLGDYRLPYWPINSFVSIFSNTAEIAHQGSVALSVDGKKKTFPFRCGDPEYSSSSMSSKRIGEGFEIARIRDTDVLKVTNIGSESPVLMEHSFVIKKGSQNIPVFVKATNLSDQTIQDVIVQVSYAQDFNWSSFGITDSEDYQQVEAPSSGEAKGFFAFSSGMDRGYGFHQIEDCRLSYKISSEMNSWRVILQSNETKLAPGASMIFRYELQVINKPPGRIPENISISNREFDLLKFRKMIPTEVRTESINKDERVTIQDVIQNLEKPKLRGILHHVSGFPQILTDLETLKDWGCNLASTMIDNPDETRQIIERSHKLGMKMFIPSVEGYSTGSPPKFDWLFEARLRSGEFPDSYGQNEDHNFWFGVKPTLNFEAEFGKPMSMATQEEKVSYWSRCFVEKWRNTLAEVRIQDPHGNIWFDIPSPGVAFVDPLNYNELFLHELSSLADLGEKFTVFPFYYGPDYNHIEYMIHAWKNAGFPRAVFRLRLPSFSKPSQFIRAITAARRGGSDGAAARYIWSDATGNYVPTDSISSFTFWSMDEWRWKAFMLAALANFPTPELKAYCFIEEPAELVEALSVCDIIVFSGDPGTKDFIQGLEKLMPGKIQWIRSLPENQPQAGQLHIVIGDDSIPGQSKWVYNMQLENLGVNKGVIQMMENVVSLNGSDKAGVENAKMLFLRFAELAKSER